MASEKARLLRQSSTDAERRLWKRCVLGSLEDYKFRRQRPLVRSSLISFALSICWSLSWMEVSTPIAITIPARTAWLQQHGWRVLRFWNNDVLLNTRVSPRRS